MRAALLATVLALAAAPARAQTAIVGDAWVLGRVLVGTTTATGRMSVAASSATGVPFQVSGVDLTPFLRVGADGTVGLSTATAARLDVMGSGDSGAIGLQARGGNAYGSSGYTQVALGANDGVERHALRSVHVSSTAHDSVDFLVWTPDAGTTSVATMTVLSLVTTTNTPGAFVHVRPVGEPPVELTVSDAQTTGGGSVIVAQQVTPSSRDFKTDIAYLDEAEGARAYEVVRALRPASFRYMRRKGPGFERNRRAPLRRGLIYEDAPEELRGPGDGLSLDQRLLEGEMAFQELARRLEKLEKEAGR